MPRIEARLVFETNLDKSPPELCNVVLDMLRNFNSEAFRFMRLQYMTQSLTEDELDKVRWLDESGTDA